jgi:hypothetical protein
VDHMRNGIGFIDCSAPAQTPCKDLVPLDSGRLQDPHAAINPGQWPDGSADSVVRLRDRMRAFRDPSPLCGRYARFDGLLTSYPM